MSPYCEAVAYEVRNLGCFQKGLCWVSSGPGAITRCDLSRQAPPLPRAARQSSSNQAAGTSPMITRSLCFDI